jgi:predicted O-methyltransferase YrrM
MSYIADYYDEHFGHASSVSAGASIDATQSPIPWITYAALFQLEQYDFGNCKVFEWGSGYSSLFWSPRVHSLVSIDHDPSWHEFVVQKNLNNVEARLVDLAKYAESIVGAAELFDVIVIDGYIHEATRYHCARLCTEYLAPGGFILLDNSDWLSNTCSYLRGMGYSQYDYVGFGPINRYPWCTSLFVPGSISIPRKEKSPGFIAGGLANVRD